MGGFGSGWQGTKRYVVEDGLVLSISNLFRIRALVPGQRTSGSIRFAFESSWMESVSISYESNLQDPDAAWLRLFYTAEGEPIDFIIRLQTTRPNYGGRRYWFLCPLARQDGVPPRRVGKLYLPPGGRYFGSREGYRLTYASCQESGRFRGIIRRMASGMGTDETTVRRALNALARQNVRESQHLKRTRG